MSDRPRTDPSTADTTYETTDLHLGAFLKACGLQLVDRRLDGRRVTFVFADHPDRKSLVTRFYGDAEIRVNEFVHALQDLKAATYNL